MQRIALRADHGAPWMARQGGPRDGVRDLERRSAGKIAIWRSLAQGGTMDEVRDPRATARLRAIQAHRTVGTTMYPSSTVPNFRCGAEIA
jgi:hypothetical protein